MQAQSIVEFFEKLAVLRSAGSNPEKNCGLRLKAREKKRLPGKQNRKIWTPEGISLAVRQAIFYAYQFSLMDSGLSNTRFFL